MQAGLGGSLLLMVGLAAASSTPYAAAVDPERTRPWSEVEAIQRAAERAKTPGYEARWGKYVLAPDGRFFMESVREEDEPQAAMLGRYTREGNWLTLRLEGSAINLDSLSAEQRKEYDEYLEQVAEYATQDEAPSAVEDEEIAAESTEDYETAESAEARARRLLVLPYRGGEALVDEGLLVEFANSWDGASALEFYPEAWRVPGLDAKAAEDHAFAIEDPLNANLPWDLVRLLRKDAIEARVSEVLDTPDNLKWEQQSAEVRVRLDRGGKHGLYKDMRVYGLPPDERVYATLEDVQPEYAIAKIALQRFAPNDPVELPTVGLRLITRPVGKGAGCSIDYSAAVRGKILGVATAAKDVKFDDEGYGWFELTLDQGSAHGLSLEDHLYVEDDDLDGEGRVRALSSDRATVLWRVQRYYEGHEVVLPGPGAAVVTQAWRSAQWEVFGSEAAMSK